MQSYSILQVVSLIMLLALTLFVFKHYSISCYLDLKKYEDTPIGILDMTNDLKGSLVVFIGKNEFNEITYLRCN